MPVGKTKPLTNFDGSNTQATSLEYHPDAAGRHTLSQSAHHTSSYHNILHLSFLALRTPSSNAIVATVQVSADAGTRWLRAAAREEESSAAAAIATELARLPQLRSPNEGPTSFGPSLLVFPY